MDSTGRLSPVGLTQIGGGGSLRGVSLCPVSPLPSFQQARHPAPSWVSSVPSPRGGPCDTHPLAPFWGPFCTFPEWVGVPVTPPSRPGPPCPSSRHFCTFPRGVPLCPPSPRPPCSFLGSLLHLPHGCGSL